MQLISFPFKSIDRNSALIRDGYGGPDELLPLEKRKQYGSPKDNIRPVSVFRWCYWHMGVIAGALWIASSLQRFNRVDGSGSHSTLISVAPT